METKHTPEPWIACDIADILGLNAGHFEIYNKPFGAGIVGWAVTKEDAARIASCVNACKGINPEAVPELLEALRECERELSVVWSRLGQVNENRHAIKARAALAKATK